MLSDRELDELAEAGESDRIEFKENAGDLREIRNTVCALANDLPNHRQPGAILVGLKDDAVCTGLKINDQLLTRLAQCRLDGSITPFPIMVVRSAFVRSCEVAAIIVQPSDNPPLRHDNRVWVRVGPTTARASPEEEKRLTERRRWGTLPFDAQGVPGATQSDLDLIRFREEYLPASVARDVLAENARSLEEQMRALRLMRPDGSPTVTAILILGNSPRDWLPGAYVQFLRIAGTALTDRIVDQKEIGGTIGDQLRQLDELIKLHVAQPLSVGGIQAESSPEYPDVALRQILRNAVLHRSYEGTNSPVRMTWYQDRIEILSPGGPFGQVTRDNFGQPGVTDYRNPTLAEALRNLRFVERFGVGLQIAQSALKENGNPPAEFRIAPTQVHVTIRTRP